MKATPDTPASEVVLENQAYAWNPSIAGIKSEDTILVLKDKNEIISEDTGWPLVEVDVDGKKILKDFDLPGKIKKTTNQKEALKDADFVISMIAVGGLDAWEIDKNIPLKYGVDQIVGDTLGPGGVFRALSR